jgi:signal transduction histidine kinase/phage shock protein PspC (stress-responsive transcriptional regulator)
MVGIARLCDHRSHRRPEGSSITTPVSRRPPDRARHSARDDAGPGPLQRRSDQRLVAGVCAGVAQWLGVDPSVVRIAFAVLAASGGVGLVLYGVLWATLPVEGTPSAAGQWLHRRTDSTRARRPVVAAYAAHGQRVLAVGLLALGSLLLFRELGLWFGDRLVWPATLAAVGLALVWPQRSARDALTFRRVSLLRIASGVLAVGAGVAVFAAANADLHALQDSLLAVVLTIAGLLLIFGPWWWRLGRDLFEERRRRIRSEERAELAARIHDSVLQTLALIQQNVGDPLETARLARRQERELRSWLFEDGPTRGGTLRSAVRMVADEVEDLAGVAVEPVVVGDCEADERVDAVVAATREALLNAAKFSGQLSVSLYVEVEPGTITAYVRDRGAGFDAAGVPPDRQGIKESIVGRMARHGGRATVQSATGRGTEVELVMPRPRS